MVVDRRSFVTAVSMAFLVAACSSSDSNKNTGTGGGSASKSKGDAGGSAANMDAGSSSDAGGTNGGKPTPAEDTAPVGNDLSLFFNPMYSAYDGKHIFKVPAVVQGVAGAKWSARPADAVDLEPDMSTGGVMITTRKAGKFLIIARVGRLSGSAPLYVTDADPADWELGNERYHNDIAFPPRPDGGYGVPDGGYADGGFPDAGSYNGGQNLPDNLACINCHGDMAMALDVEHTPQQTGGYSDDDLIGIFTMGMKPKGSKFHTPFPPALYQMFHTWDATDAEKKGLVVYLRSLEPKSQGMLDFSGLTGN